MAKCPSCNAPILHARFKPIESRQSFGTVKLNSNAHCCPSCDIVLSVEVDPIALMSDTVNKIMKRLGKA